MSGLTRQSLGKRVDTGKTSHGQQNVSGWGRRFWIVWIPPYKSTSCPPAFAPILGLRLPGAKDSSPKRLGRYLWGFNGFVSVVLGVLGLLRLIAISLLNYDSCSKILLVAILNVDFASRVIVALFLYREIGFFFC